MTKQNKKLKIGFPENFNDSFKRKTKEAWVFDLVTNAHDADAEKVKIIFQGFDKNYQSLDKSKIIVQDDGNGIEKNMLEKFWFSNSKIPTAMRKKNGEKTLKGRLSMGGGGKGRFGLLLIGRYVKITTLPKHSKDEYVMGYNAPATATEEINVSYETRQPTGLQQHGAIFEISRLNDNWNRKSVVKIIRKLIRRRKLFSERGTENFEVSIYKDNTCIQKISYSQINKFQAWLLIIKENIALTFKGLKI